jgi:hypothetical protein
MGDVFHKLKKWPPRQRVAIFVNDVINGRKRQS